MDLKLIKNLLNMISDSDVSEVSIEEGDFKIKIKKHGEPAAPREQVYYMPPAAAPAPAPAAAAPQAPAPSAAAESKPAASSSGVIIKSPIVGTYYEAPSPESDPFIKVGDKVKKGDVLCIVEAMKIMNEIESEYDGTITKMLVSNSQPVEFDQPLFEIDPA